MTVAAPPRFPVNPPRPQKRRRADGAVALFHRSTALVTRASGLLGIVLAASLLAACAGSTVQQHDEPVRDAVRSMPGDADALAGAALQAWAQRDPGQAFALIRRAVQHDENRPDLAWLQIRLCAEIRGCEPAPFEARLRRLDPANGVAWLGALGRAGDRQDHQAEASLLDAMSRTSRFDLYWTRLVSRLTLALNVQRTSGSGTKGHPPRRTDDAALTSTLNDIIGWLSQLATPAFRPLTAACDPPRAHATGAAARCASIAAILQDSDTALAEALGLGIAQRLATPGSPQAALLDRRIGILRYRGQSAVAIMEGQAEREKFSAEVLELMKNLSREQDVTGAILRWAGQPLDPDG